MGKERKRLSRHTRVIKSGSSSFLIQSFQLSILNTIAKDPRPGCNLKMLIAKLESTCLVLVRFVLFRCSFLCCNRIFQANSKESCSLLHHRVRKIWPLKLSNCWVKIYS